MTTVMILRGFANGLATPHDGEFLKDFDFEADNGRGLITMTPHEHEAKRFATMAEAFTFHRTVPKCRPLRSDLRPNRPLTATNWEFRVLEEAS